MLAFIGDYELEATACDEWGTMVVEEGDHDAYSVYLRLPRAPDGHRYAEWVADFAKKEDAVEFMLYKGLPE